MNKYVVRTSLVWIGIFVVAGAALFLHRSHHSAAGAKTNSTQPTPEQPVAQGPAPTAASQSGAMPGMTGSPTSEPSQAPAEMTLTPAQITPQRMQSIGVQTGTVEYKHLESDIRATGNVNIDERLLAYVQVRFPGYIRKVIANATYLYVRKGDPLFTVYSPDLVATQQEYLLARQDEKALSASTVDGVAAGAAALSAAAEQRLQQWEVSPGELARLKQTGKPIVDLTINSPVSGYITEYNALPNMYVEPSTRLYTVADLSSVWVYAQVFQDDVGRLKPGDAASIAVDSYPGQTFFGRIDDILPQVDLATRTVRVRLVIANRNLKLKPGMFVNVDLKSPLGRRLVVPASAVFQTGTRQLVFLDQGDSRLDPKEVLLGPRAGDEYVVLEGLKAHQKIVTSADFLIDSESQLQAAAGSFAPLPPGAGSSNPLPAAQAEIDFTTDPNPPHKGADTFRVKLANPSGAPIDGAQVSVSFYMPAMPEMGMSAMKTTVTLGGKGGGLYEGRGTLESGGSWQVTIAAQQNGKMLTTELLHVNVEGSM